MILASTRVGLPFRVRLPEDFATTSEEIGTYETNYRWSDSSHYHASLFTLFDHTAMLVFWRSDSIIYSKIVEQLIIGSVGEKGRVNPRSDLVVVNCLEGLNDGKVRWKLAKKRVDRMKREGDWEVAIFRSDFCAISELFRIYFFSAVRMSGGPNTDPSLQSARESPHRSGEKSSSKTGANVAPSREVVRRSRMVCYSRLGLYLKS